MASKKAKELYKKIARDPNNPRLYQQLGDIYRWEEDIKEAMNAYQKAAEMYEQQQKPHAAVPLYKQVLSLDPERPDIQVRLAGLLIKLDSHGEAHSQLEAALIKYEAAGDATNVRRVKKMLDEIVHTTWSQRVADAINLFKEGNRAKAANRLKEVVRDLAMSQKSPLEAYRLFLERVYEPAIFDDFVHLSWQESKIDGIIALFEKLDKPAQGEPLVLEAVADASLQLGKNSAAVEFYELLLDEFSRRGDRKQASRVAIQLLQTDPNNAKAKAVAEKGEGVKEKKAEQEEIEIELEWAEPSEDVALKVFERKPKVAEEALLSPEEIFGEVEEEKPKVIEPMVEKAAEEIKPALEERPPVEEKKVEAVFEEVAPEERVEQAVAAPKKVEEVEEKIEVEVEVEAAKEIAEKPELKPEEKPEEKISEDQLRAILEESIERDLRGAISGLKSYLRAHPSEFQWQYKLAELYIKSGDVNSAKSQIEKCVHLAKNEGLPACEIDCWNLLLVVEPTSELAHLSLKDIYRDTNPKEAVKHLEALARLAREQDQFQQSIDFYEEIVEVDSNYLEAHEELKDYYLKQSRIPEALNELHKLVELLLVRGEVAQAESNLRQILEIEPADRDARGKLFEITKQKGELGAIESELFVLEELYQNLGNLDEALALLEEGLSAGLPEDKIRSHMKQIYFMRGQTDKAVQQLRSLVDIANKASDSDKALSYLDEILRVSPEDFQAHEQVKDICSSRKDVDQVKRELFFLIDLARSKGDVGRLEKYLKELVERDPADESSKVELVNLYLNTDRRDLAEKMLFEMASSELARGDLLSAEGAFQRILEINPKSEEARRGLVKVYIDRDQRRKAANSLWELAQSKIEKNDFESAKSILNEVLTIWPEHEESLRARVDISLKMALDDEATVAMLELAALYQREGKLDDAISALEKVIERRMDMEVAYQRLAQIHQSLGHPQKASDVLLRLASWLRHTGHLARAIEVLTDILEAAPEHEQARLARKEMYLNSGNRPKAVADLFALADQFQSQPEKQKEFFGGILDLDPKNLVARERIIAILKEQKKFTEAIEHIKYLLGEAIKEERFSEVLERARQIMELDPASLDVRKELAETYRRLGDPKRAVNELIAVAKMYLDRNESDMAEQLLRAAVEEDPEATSARLMLAELYQSQGDNERASQEFHRFADYFASVGALNEAQKTLRTILSYSPSDELALKKLADFERRLGKREEAIAILFDLANRAKSSGRLSEAEEHNNQILRIEPFNTQAQLDLSSVLVEKGEKERAAEKLLLLSSRLSLTGRLDEANAQLDRILEFLPAHERALYFKAELAQKRGDIYAAVDNLCLAAEAEVSRGDIMRAQRLLRQALKLEPLNFRAHDQLVRLYLKEERKDSAVAEITKFVKSLVRNQRYDEAQKLLERALELDPSSRPVLTTLKEIALAKQDMKRAMELLQTLAHLAKEQKLLDEEELSLKEIVSLDLENADAHSLLVDKYLRDGRKDMALSEIYRLAELKVQNKKANEAEVLYMRASSIDPDAEMPHQKLLELYTKQERVRDVINEYMVLAEISPRKGQFTKELDYLHKVMSLDHLNFEAHRKLKERYLKLGRNEEAIEELATFAEALKRENKIVEAIEIYEELLSLNRDQPELLMTLARLLLEAQRTQQAVLKLEEAVKVARKREVPRLEEEALKELLNLDPTRTTEREVLAGLLATSGRLKEASDEYQVLAERAKDTGDLNRAILWLGRIVELVPDHITAHELLKQAYLEQNRVAEAQIELEILIGLNRERANQKAALSYLDELLRIAQDSESAYLLAADMHKERNDLEELVADLVKLDEIAFQSGDPEKGWGYLKSAIDLAPNRVDLLERSTERALAIGQKEEAIKYLVKLSELEAQNPAKRGDYLKKIMELDHTRSTVRRLLARAYEDAGNKKKAIAEYFILVDEAVRVNDRGALKPLLESIVGLDPTNVEAGWRLVDVYVEENKPSRALKQLFALVDMAIESGRRKLAEMFLREIFKHEPQNAKAKDKLADLFLKFVEIKEENERIAFEAEHALHSNDFAGAHMLLKQLSHLEPENFRIKEKLEELELRLVKGAPQQPIVEEKKREVVKGEEEVQIDWAEQRVVGKAEVRQEIPVAIDYEALLEEAEQFIRGELYKKALQKLEKTLQHPDFAQRSKVYLAWIAHKEGNRGQAIIYLAELDFNKLPEKERKIALALKKRLES